MSPWSYVRVRFRVDQLGRIRSDLLGVGNVLVGLLEAALLGQEACHIDKAADPLRRCFDGAAQLLFGAAQFLALFGDPRLRPVALSNVDLGDLLGRLLGLIDTAAEESRSCQVILEEIAQSLQISRI